MFCVLHPKRICPTKIWQKGRIYPRLRCRELQEGNPTLETMSAIAYALDVPLSYLLEHHDLDPESLSLLDGSQSTLPPNYEKITVILPRYKAFQVKKWNDDALKVLAKETK